MRREKDPGQKKRTGIQPSEPGTFSEEQTAESTAETCPSSAEGRKERSSERNHTSGENDDSRTGRKDEDAAGSDR